MIARILEAIGRFFSRLLPIRAGARRGKGEDPGGAGVPASLPPRVPVLVGAAARSLPPDD